MDMVCRYELEVQHMQLLDWYGGAHRILPQEYFAADLQQYFGSCMQRCSGAACVPHALSNMVSKWLSSMILRTKSY